VLRQRTAHRQPGHCFAFTLRQGSGALCKDLPDHSFHSCLLLRGSGPVNRIVSGRLESKFPCITAHSIAQLKRWQAPKNLFGNFKRFNRENTHLNDRDLEHKCALAHFTYRASGSTVIERSVRRGGPVVALQTGGNGDTDHGGGVVGLGRLIMRYESQSSEVGWAKAGAELGRAR
jgi:hypothetical protein